MELFQTNMSGRYHGQEVLRTCLKKVVKDIDSKDDSILLFVFTRNLPIPEIKEAACAYMFINWIMQNDL